MLTAPYLGPREVIRLGDVRYCCIIKGVLTRVDFEMTLR